MKTINYKSNYFKKEEIKIGGTSEYIVKGGRDQFDNVKKVFKDAGIKQIGVIGWSSQGPAQAQNLRDTLEGSGIKVKVGLRNGSNSIPKANEKGFKKESGTLGEMYQVIKESDMVLLLIADAAQADNWEKIVQSIKPGATLGLSHGFLIGYLDSIDKKMRDDINIVAVCPKGMGPSVRRLYEQGKEINGAGINASFAVEQDIDGKATDIALAWAAGLGAPFTFATTMRHEYRSDITGERAILLGAVHGICESLYTYYKDAGKSPEESFKHTAESITGPISKMISEKGMIGVYKSFEGEEKKKFEIAYSAAYHPIKDICYEIYDEVESGNEVKSVIMANHRFKIYPMTKIDDTPMWKVGEKTRAKRDSYERPYDPTTAGIYVAGMMALADMLADKGHSYSEIVNESIIEAVDSLNPYMDFKGISYMVDNCSTTARLGARKWAPRFDYNLRQLAYPKLNSGKSDKLLIDQFTNSPVHEALSICAKLRPSVDIAVV